MDLNSIWQLATSKHYGNAFNYWHYYGGLTTPPCNEAAQFIIAQEPIKVSRAQIEKFELLKDPNESFLTNTFRSIQDLDCRKVADVRRN